MIERTLTVQTPEGVTFSWTLAGPITRMLALIIDTCCVAAATQGLRAAVEVVHAVSADWGVALNAVLFFGLDVGYAIALEWLWRGQTVGKRVLGIRVIDAGGLRLSPAQVIVRNVLRAVDALPLFYGAGGLACAVSPRAQRFGDMGAGTVVIRHESAEHPQLSETLRLQYNSLRQWPTLCARLRQRCTPQEAEAALSAVLRRDELDPEARLELFDDLARHFQAKQAFPPEALDGLSSEQYVRDVVQILFSSGRK